MAAFDGLRGDGWKTGWLDYRRKRFWVWVAIAVYTLLGFVVVPWIARGVIVDQVHKQLGLAAKLDKVEFNPYALIVRLKGFSLNERSGRQMIAFDEVDANLQLSSLFYRAWTFADIRFVHPYVRVEHNEESGTLNLLQLVPPPDPHAKPEPAGPPPRLIIEKASIEGGRASVADKTERQTYETELGPVDLTMTTISTLPNREGRQTLVVRTGFGGQLEWKGDLGLEPLRSDGHISFAGEELAPISAYLPPELKMVINDGRLDVAFDYKMAAVKGGVSLDLTNIAVKLAKLGVAQTVDGTPTEWLSLDEFAIDGGRLQWPDQKFTAQRIAMTAPKIAMSRDAQQRFVWERLWQADGGAATPAAAPPEPVAANAPTGQSIGEPTSSQPAESPPPANVAPPTDAPPNAVTGVVQRTAPTSASVGAPEAATPATAQPSASAAATPSPWTVEIAKFEIVQGHVGFADHSIEPAGNVGISDLAVNVERLTLADGASMPFTMNFSVDGGGTVALEGTAIVQPNVSVDARAKIADVALAVANPYVNALTYLQIAGGGLGIEGHLISAPQEILGFDGTVSVANLDVQRTDVPGRLLGWKGLAVTGMTMSLQSKHVDFARIELDSAYARVHVSSNRVLNFATVMREGAPAAPNGATQSPVATGTSTAPATPAPPTAIAQAGQPPSAVSATATAPAGAPSEPPWSVKLGRMRVTNADVDYTDESLPIPFSRSITKLSGGIDAFDSQSSAPTRLKLTGQVGEYGQVKISGELRALDPLKQTNINASFKNLDMPGASAYAIRFAGRKVASGRLDVDMHYVLRDGMLDGDHKIVVRDFQLGEKVPYPDALDLPYDLAISLLKDSSGNINVDLPVEGNVNDPTFRIGGVIMHALANLITQIITSPFRLLGRLVGLGDSEGFDQVLFEPGSADLAPPEQEKIAKVADALVLRPNLAVMLHGVSNELADSRALRARAVRARLNERVGNADAKGRLKIVQKMVNESIPGLSLDPIKAQFTAAPTPDAKPVLDEGAYMKALVGKLVAAEPLPPNALDSLASARATAVHDALTANTQLDAARVMTGDTKQALLKDDEVPLKFELASH